MDTFLIVLGIICLIAGFAGSFLPVLPGPPLAWVALLLLNFTSKADFTTQFLIITT